METKGQMDAIVKDDETKTDIELAIVLLKEQIAKDKQNNDEKSLKYHTLALNKYEEQLNKMLNV